MPFFLSNIIKKGIFIQLNDLWCETITLIFSSHWNTETAFIKALNDTHGNSDSSRVSVIALLALFASVKTLEHIILIDRLEISGSALNWFKS